jgi:AraC-like DNA-binding protein
MVRRTLKFVTGRTRLVIRRPSRSRGRLDGSTTRLSDVVDDLRRARALEYLRAGKTIAEVAGLVGFADPSALFRAYRRWTGTTPGADRAED